MCIEPLIDKDHKLATAQTNQVEDTRIPWWLVLIQGISAIFLGILLLFRPTATTLLLVQFLGIYWLISGFFSLISLIWDRSEWGWKLFSGILGILAGLMIIQNPLWSTLLVPATLAWMLGFIGIFIGILQIFQAFRGAGWGAGILGVLSILLGLLLITRPVFTGLALAWILAGLLLVGGILAIFAAFASRNEQNQPEGTASQPVSQASAPQAPVTEPSSAPIETTAVKNQSESISTAEAVAAGSTTAVAASPVAAGVAGEDDEQDVIEVGEQVGEEGIVEIAEDDGEVAFFEVAEAVVEEQEPETVEEADAEAAADEITGNVDPNDPEEMAKFKYSLGYVEGIGPVYAGELEKIGLISCLDLLKAGSSRKGREDIVNQTGISGKLILKWVNQLDLYRIKGVGQEYADLLEASGVDTVLELAQRNPANLAKRMLEVSAEKNMVRKLPTLSQVEDWVFQAKDLPRVITY